ncbi:MAG: hypothetical protein WDN23_11680 [Edaphobacter sp.]
MFKKKLIYLLPVLSAILVVGGSKAQAQVMELKAKIPFEFHAGAATLPAGNYTINVLGGLESRLIEIRSDDNHSAALLQTMDTDFSSVSKTPELLFNQTGGNYYLASIFDQDGNFVVGVKEAGYAKKYQASIAAPDMKQVAVVSQGF